MNKGYIKRIGDQTVDIQLAGSTTVIPRVKTSGQIDIFSLVLGEAILASEVNGEYVVLHTLDDNLRESSIANAAVSLSTNPLLADGSVPLTGNLYVTPGITIDGYDISVLGQTISNLQAADTIVRTGWTAFTHSTHLVSTIDADATEILVRDAIFELYEQVALSNISGEIEFMRIDSASTQTVDDEGVVCYQYTVTRRVQLSPSNLFTGWAAATLVNGLTSRGYITIDNRHQNSINSPNITGVVWTNDPPTTQERVFRLGDLNGILGITTNDFGAAFGNLDTQDQYFIFNASTGSTDLKNTNITILDIDGNNRVKVYGRNENDRLAGDYTFGLETGVHTSLVAATETWGVYRGTSAQIEVTADYSFIRDLLTIGNPTGARITLGEEDGRSIIALRNKHGAIKALLSTDESGDVFAHIGNAPPEANSASFDGATGLLNIDGHVIMRSASVAGRLEFATTGEFMVVDPDDPGRFGVTTPRGQYAYTTDSTGTTHLIRVDAWGPLVLEDVLGSGTWRTWVGGSQMFGDPRYRHFRIERGATARAGFFNGETPAVYLDATGKAVFGDPAGDTITIDTVSGIRFINPVAEPALEGASASELDEDHMITVWLDINDPSPAHRISAWRSDGTPKENTLFLQAEPPTGERARTLISALSDYQSRVQIRAIGGYDTANQQATQLTLHAYNAEGGGVFSHRRFDIDTDITRLYAYTAATIPGGTIQNGSILHSNGTYDPGAGAGVYIYYGGYWVPVATQGNATGWEAVDNSDDGMTAGAIDFYTCSASGGSFTINLPDATTLPRNQEYTFYKSDSSGNTITIDPYGAATVNGSSNYVLSSQYQVATFRRVGANWNIKST